MGGRLWVGGALGALLIAAGVAALARADDDPQTKIDPLVRAATGDPLELGRFTEAEGDAYVLERLSDETRADTRLAAIRAAVWLDGPERSLGKLAGIAAERDPDLAPAAAWSCYRIATSLDPVALERREVLLSELRPASKRLAELAGDETARPDIRRVAAFAADALTHLDPAKQDVVK